MGESVVSGRASVLGWVNSPYISSGESEVSGRAGFLGQVNSPSISSGGSEVLGRATLGRDERDVLGDVGDTGNLFENLVG